MNENLAKLIAVYLPQFHPFKENDEWWGKGFTEWTNVAKSIPKFSGHYQPHLPRDLGFYDLRLPEARERQVELAREYGIGGFCYYHYWFNGKRLMERPITEVLASGKPDFPFCFCWANENWTRRWDGLESEILAEQRYSEEDDVNHIRSLFSAFEDKRYIRVNGRPLFSVYRTGHMPNPERTAEIWREEAMRAGIGELYLCRFEAWDGRRKVDPLSIGFDASIEFAPDWAHTGGQAYSTWKADILRKTGVLPSGLAENRLYDYRLMRRSMMAKEIAFPTFRCVTPGFDNSARRTKGAHIIRESSPDEYEAWLMEALSWTAENNPPERQLVFVNAWNEWAEGNHLEPDLRFGTQYLEATRRALVSSAKDRA